MGFGVGSSEGIFVAQEGLKIIVALNSAKGIVFGHQESCLGSKEGSIRFAIVSRA